MIPVLSKGAGIKGTALYVLHDVRTESERAIGAELTPEQQTQHRVGWTTTRNLSTDDPELAWKLMCATAKAQDALKQNAGVRPGGRPSKYQCGHIALSWEHQTKPDPAEMNRAAEGALKALGWEQLQALIVEHKDHDHSHVHIVVCLVDPETGRNAPHHKNDYGRLQRWAHEYDKARGLEVCPQRAEKMERKPDDPALYKPGKQWLSRQEYEAVRDSERAEGRAQALARFRDAKADVREQFRPEWAELFREQRGELRDLDKQQRDTLRQLGQAAKMRRAPIPNPDRRYARDTGANRRNGMAAFVNAHRAEIFLGINPAEQPTHHQLLTPSYVRAALERAQMAQRADMVERHREAKTELQGRHRAAHQDAYRAAFRRPEPKPAAPAPAVTATPETPARKGGRIGAGLAAAAIAAGAAYVLSRKPDTGERVQEPRRDPKPDRKPDPQPDPERDLAQAAERISRQQTRATSANDVARVLKAEEPQERDTLSIMRERLARAHRTHGRDPALDIGRERTRIRD
jgi:hypothetical protein